jgi:outer membrane protein TolC
LPDVPDGKFSKDAPFIQKKNQWGGQIQVNQAILAPGLWFAISAAYAGDDAAESSSENGRRQILFGAAQTYYGAASLKQAVTVQERQLAVTRDHERDAKVRYDAGTTPKVALLRAQIDRARSEQDLQRSRNNYASAKVALATIVGRSGDFDVAVPVEPQPPSQDLPTLEQAALHDRPDVSAAAAQTKVADRSRNGTYMQYLPTIGAFGKYIGSNVGGFSGQDWTWALGLALNWNIFDGGLREASIRENEAKVAEAEASQRSTEAKALQDVQQALLDYQSAQANKAKATEQLSLARENSKLIEVNYKAGAATYLEVADANSALLSAELGEVAETLNTQLAALRLEQAAGAFNPKG